MAIHTKLTNFSKGGSLSRIDGETEDIPGPTTQSSFDEESTEQGSTEKPSAEQGKDETNECDPLPWTFAGSINAKEGKATENIVRALMKIFFFFTKTKTRTMKTAKSKSQ